MAAPTAVAERRRLPPSLFREDLLASLVVFLVALPLCLGISIASGVPPALGLLTGVLGGLLVGVLAGSPLQVSGPAAGLAVIVYEIVQEHGIAGMGCVVLVGGLIQLAAGLLRAGQWFRAVSPAVIQGMLAGIGALILASQFHVMLDDQPPGDGLRNLVTIPLALFDAVRPQEGTAHHLAALIGLLTIGTTVLWTLFGSKRVPAPLLAVLIATGVTIAFDLPILRVEVPDELWDSLTFPSLTVVREMGVRVVLLEGLALAFIASAETLLCATAVDQMHQGQRTDYDRELTAQGVGNLSCGFLGLLPMTGVIVRSSANVTAGAKTRWAAVFHGAWLLAMVVFAPQLLSLIPTSCLAAILVYTGYKLVNPLAIRKLHGLGKGEVATYAVTFAGVVAIDLLSGVLLGLGLAAARLLLRLSGLELEVREQPNQVDLDLRGAATFIGLPKLARTLETLGDGKEVHLHLRELRYIDHACMELLGGFIERYEKTGGHVVVEWDEVLRRYHGRPPGSESSRP